MTSNETSKQQPGGGGVSAKRTGNHPKSRSSLSAVTHAFMEHNLYLKSFLRRFMKRPQDIEDIAQEAYIRAFKVEQDTGVDHPKTLLFTIAKNIALNELRSKAKKVTDYIEECEVGPDSVGATTEDEVLGLERLEAYCAAVDNLPEQCRRVYLLRKVHGLAHKEIAERLNITVRTVERHLQKGVMRCRAHMLEEEALMSQTGPGGAQKSKVTNLTKEGAQ